MQDSSGYPRTIEGLLKYWNHEAAPYSFFDEQHNKKEMLIAHMREISLETGEWLHGNKMLFNMIGDNAAVIYLETAEGLTRVTYMKKQEDEFK